VNLEVDQSCGWIGRVLFFNSGLVFQNGLS
jgi:hypothetical protein